MVEEGGLLNVTLLAYASDEQLYSTRADFPNQAEGNRAGDEKLVQKVLGQRAQRGQP